jgi:predicted TIM-barrel fold metal-dependent hydrolase
MNITNTTRREFLTGLAGFRATALLSSRALGQGQGNPRRIDFHHHYVSPGWLKMLTEKNAIKPVMGFDVIKGYSVSKALELMDQGGVATGMLSTTTPGVWFGNIDETRRAAREMNEFGARMVADHKGRFGLFAVLPLPDIEASLREIDYAYSALKADGISFVSSYNDRWLGDVTFAPVWEELNRRNAVVYTHATAPGCCLGNFVPGVGATTVELSSDLARTIVNVIQSGTANKTPNVRYIWSHGGGSIWAQRYFGAEIGEPVQPNSKLYHLQRFYYDTAAAADRMHMGVIRLAVPMSQVLFGTDLPWGVPANIVAGLQKAGLTPAELRGIDRENGVKLVPRFAS